MTVLPSAEIVLIDISTHTLRKEGDDCFTLYLCRLFHISTHTLRKEGDDRSNCLDIVCSKFQPTPSARRVTLNIGLMQGDRYISTHTLRKEGDTT